MAKGAQLMEAGMLANTPLEISNSVTWALNNGADVVNVSQAASYTGNLAFIDQALDWTVRLRGAIVVVAAGNRPDLYVSSPGIAYNVITVGSSNHNGTGNPVDDIMWNNLPLGSSFINPVLGHQKPDVVAPGAILQYVDCLRGWAPDQGTSLAAPQVAGLAALLVDSQAALDNNPLAVKAIILATAVTMSSAMDGVTALSVTKTAPVA